MVNSANIKIWNELVGSIFWDDQKQLAFFEYSEDFKKLEIELAPLKMPVSSKKRIFSFPNLRPRSEQFDTFKGLPGLLADALPDKYGNDLMNVWLSQNGRELNSSNPLEQLLFIGPRGMGALEFEPSEHQKAKIAFDVELSGMVHTAHKIVQNREKFNSSLNEKERRSMLDILKIGTSAGGARPKAIIAYNEKTNEVKSGQTTAPKGFEQWLIKLDGVSDAQFGQSQGFGRVEMAYYLMAKDCEIDIMPCKLMEEKGRAHFMTKRFDRDGANTKHHIQTLCAINHFDFCHLLSYGYEQIFATMRKLRLNYPQAEQMYRRMVFNVLAKNCDDHTKNFAFRLKQNNKWELAPAYDICYAYSPTSLWVSQQTLSVNGKRVGISKDDLLLVAKNVGIKKADKIISQIKEKVKNWNNYAEETNVNSILRDNIGFEINKKL